MRRRFGLHECNSIWSALGYDSCYEQKSRTSSTIFDQSSFDNEERPQTAPREGGGGGGEAEEQRLFLLAEQTEAFLLVFLSFARARLGGRRGCDRGRQRLSACGGGGRAVAAGRDLGLLAGHGGGDGRDPRVHLLLEHEQKETKRKEAVRAGSADDVSDRKTTTRQ